MRADAPAASPPAAEHAPPVAAAPNPAGPSPHEHPEPPPEPLVAQLRRGLREARAIQAMLAALVAWAITVAPAAFSRGGPPLSRVTATLALLAGLAAPPFAGVRRRLARHVGISLFLALATVSWLLASPAIQPGRLDPVRAAIGAIAWGVFALTWGDRWPAQRVVPADPDAPLLQARAHLPLLAAPLAAVGALTSLALVMIAWRVRDADRALLAQAAAVACAVALTSATADVAVSRGRRQPSGARRLSRYAIRPLVILIAFALAGAIVMVLRAS